MSICKGRNALGLLRTCILFIVVLTVLNLDSKRTMTFTVDAAPAGQTNEQQVGDVERSSRSVGQDFVAAGTAQSIKGGTNGVGAALSSVIAGVGTIVENTQSGPGGTINSTPNAILQTTNNIQKGGVVGNTLTELESDSN